MQPITKNTLKIVPGKNEFEAYVDKWITASKANGLSLHTTGEYERIIARFIWWFCDHSLHARTLGYHPSVITLDILRQFVAYLRDDQPAGRWGLPVAKGNGWTGATKAGLSPTTIKNYVTVVKIFFAWLEEEGYIEKTPFTRALKIGTTKKEQSKVIKNISDSDIVKIFELLTRPERTMTYEGCRNLAMVSFLLDTGVRRGELLSVKLGDLDNDKKRCKVRGKTGERYVFYSETTRSAIRRYQEEHRNEQSDDSGLALWLTKDDQPMANNTLGSMIYDLSKHSGVKFHCHTLRHSFATIMAASGVNVFDLRTMLGHASIDTTQIYVQSNPDMLQAAYRDRAPLANLEVGHRRRGRPRRA